MKDYFECLEETPEEVQTLVNKYSLMAEEENFDGYALCKALVKDLEAKGWTCEYGLSAEPYDLQPMKVCTLHEWGRTFKSVICDDGTRYQDMESYLLRKEQHFYNKEEDIFELFYAKNRRYWYCNGAYFEFEDKELKERYSKWYEGLDEMSHYNLYAFGSLESPYDNCGRLKKDYEAVLH